MSILHFGTSIPLLKFGREEYGGVAPVVKTYFHADDFGITTRQAHDILSLSTICGGEGALNSLSIFANSPAFPDAAAMVHPYLDQNDLRICLHINLVEGPCASDPSLVPLLVDERGMFCRDFLGLLKLNMGPHQTQAFAQIALECQNQIRKFTNAFPDMKSRLCLDSHQHTHAIPLVYKALAHALTSEGCTVDTLRAPLDPLSVYHALNAGSAEEVRNKDSLADKVSIPLANRAKVFLINLLWDRCPANAMPWASKKSMRAPLFCGVALSGEMHHFSSSLLSAFETEAARQHRPLEILFHPVSVPLGECLDPQKVAFAKACASLNRDKEALVLRRILAG